MPQGGQRVGAGRPKGTGKFGEPTKAIRVPISNIDDVYKLVENGFYRLPFYQTAVSAGYPSPAADEAEETLDLNELLVKRPSSTFLLKVSGSSMIKAGIHDADILVVDRSITATHGKIVIASLNGEFTVKRLSLDGDQVQLIPENDDYSPIDISEDVDLRIWGVVTSVIHPL